VASALAFNFFHIPPTGRFTISEGENWVALVVFFVAALVASTLAERARARTREAQERRQEADLAAEMARLLLRGSSLDEALPTVSQRLANAIELREVDGDERRVALRLGVGTLLVPAGTPAHVLERLQERIVPALEAILGAAIERDALQREVVETSALRRSDVLKTALLRSVSHDLRSPLTAILTAVGALESRSLSDEERAELVADIGSEAQRLSRLVDKLLDLSRLEARTAEPRVEWCSVEEVVQAAVDELALPPGTFSLSIDADLPLIRADAAQLERAFANLLENSARHAGGHPVSVRARAVGPRILVRIVDRGPGIPAAEKARIFEPFYRAPEELHNGHRGSGLGLAIVRGFVEANGGRVWVESLPGQGATFVVELPLEPVPA
jgi:two-component system sensor histidine kinase KdpD